ncbi:MAG TPA: Fe-S cluster assembly ATPase SufC [Thermoflexia bacterium]|nr:Fe-S cluster assembly ATPase SufC [Thermoflexia bacterium]
MNTLEIRDLQVRVADEEETGILKGANLVIRAGEIHALMGPNGSGKSTLSYALMGHPRYVVTGGDILLNGESILGLAPDERARRGLFLAMQYPVAISGVTLYSFLRAAVSARRGYGQRAHESDGEHRRSPLIPGREFRQEVRAEMAKLEMDRTFLRRYLNEGFSGGEKKRAEILQLALLKPEFAILDETDSGLDIDALRIVAASVNRLQRELNMGLLIITHYQRILNYIHPDFVHIFYEGQIVKSDGAKLAKKLEAEGYDWVREQFV